MTVHWYGIQNRLSEDVSVSWHVREEADEEGPSSCIESWRGREGGGGWNVKGESIEKLDETWSGIDFGLWLFCRSMFEKCATSLDRESVLPLLCRKSVVLTSFHGESCTTGSWSDRESYLWKSPKTWNLQRHDWVTLRVRVSNSSRMFKFVVKFWEWRALPGILSKAP